MPQQTTTIRQASNTFALVAVLAFFFSTVEYVLHFFSRLPASENCEWWAVVFFLLALCCLTLSVAFHLLDDRR